MITKQAMRRMILQRRRDRAILNMTPGLQSRACRAYVRSDMYYPDCRNEEYSSLHNAIYIPAKHNSVHSDLPACQAPKPHPFRTPQRVLSELFARNLYLATRGARCVTCYLPMSGEPDTMFFIRRSRRIQILLPVARTNGKLYWRQWRSTPSRPGPFGTRHPAGDNLVYSNKVDVMLIPAAAVDKRGYRLGWGGGYYDRCLAKLRRRVPVFAVVFDNEIFDEVPTDHWDRRVSGVITEKRILQFHH